MIRLGRAGLNLIGLDSEFSGSDAEKRFSDERIVSRIHSPLSRCELDGRVVIGVGFATRPGVGLRACKQAIDLAFDLSEDEAVERTLDLSRQVFATADCKEAVRAFLARETPRFTHR